MAWNPRVLWADGDDPSSSSAIRHLDATTTAAIVTHPRPDEPRPGDVVEGRHDRTLVGGDERGRDGDRDRDVVDPDRDRDDPDRDGDGERRTATAAATAARTRSA